MLLAGQRGGGTAARRGARHDSKARWRLHIDDWAGWMVGWLKWVLEKRQIWSFPISME